MVPHPDDLSLEQKLGQMLLLGFRGTVLEKDNPIVSDIRDHQIGGVILFDYDVVRQSADRNIASPEQVRALTADLKSLSQIPLFVSIDQEGGTVNRLKPDFGFPPTFSHKELGEKDDLAFTYEHGRAIASLVRRHGHNVNFAPCLDLGINKQNKAIYGRDRCFSDDPEVAALHASAYVRAHRDEGVIAAAKHFPGHGSSLEDTHLGMADVTKSWQEYEVLPYQRLMDEGLVEMIMTTHIFNRRLDEKWPATLSPRVLKDMLRKRMGFEGVIISDDLQMKAISGHYGDRVVMEQALLAGVDILAYGNNLDFDPGLASRFIRIAKQLLDDGKISVGRINDSVMRILLLKEKMVTIEKKLKKKEE